MTNTEGTRPFKPEDHLIDLPKRSRQPDGSWANTTAKYMEVSARLLWLRTEHPDAVIRTECLANDSTFAQFRAEVSIPGGGSATGHGMVNASDFGAFYAKCETQAIGRALAALGYGTAFALDEFELDSPAQPAGLPDTPIQRSAPPPAKPHAPPSRQDSTPGGQSAARPDARDMGTSAAPAPTSSTQGHSSPPPRTQGGANPTAPATEPQVKALYAIGRSALNLNDAEVDERAFEEHGVAPSGLTRRQASELIDKFKREAGQTVTTR